jgi:glutathione S-transferase
VVHVDLSSKPSWFTRDVNPRGLVPALVHARHPDGALLESLQICRQLDALVPQPPLTPQDARAAAQMQQLLQQADSIVSAGEVAGARAHEVGCGGVTTCVIMCRLLLLLSTATGAVCRAAARRRLPVLQA